MKCPFLLSGSMSGNAVQIFNMQFEFPKDSLKDCWGSRVLLIPDTKLLCECVKIIKYKSTVWLLLSMGVAFQYWIIVCKEDRF